MPSLKLSPKNKIYIAITLWVVVVFILFWYGFPVFERVNLSAANQVLNKSKQFQELQQQQASYQAGKNDLETMSKKPYQPTDFFSKDTSVVNEIEALEKLAKDNSLELELTVTGTKAGAAKAPTQGDFLQIPYTLSLTGTTANLVNFLQYYENLKFITHAQALDITTAKEGQIRATMSAVFYVQK